MPDLGMIARATKRVTLDDIYVSLDSLRDQQAEGFRHLNQRIDTEIGQVRQEIGQTNQRIDALSQKIDTQIGQVNQKIDTQIGQVNQKIDTQIGQVNQRIDQLNQRFDTVIQMILDLSKQISSQKNQ